MEAPVINVGIMTHKAISFVFNEEYVPVSYTHLTLPTIA